MKFDLVNIATGLISAIVGGVSTLLAARTQAKKNARSDAATDFEMIVDAYREQTTYLRQQFEELRREHEEIRHEVEKLRDENKELKSRLSIKNASK